jgi:hypothetical protein
LTLAVPPGSITAGFLAKEPGAQMRLGTAEMTFRYADSPGAANALEGYQRLLLERRSSSGCGSGVAPDDGC